MPFRPRTRRDLVEADTLAFNYDCVGATMPTADTWAQSLEDYRVQETSLGVGDSDAVWHAACAAVLDWSIKTKSGFSVSPPASSAVEGQSLRLSAGIWKFRISEPVRIVEVVDEPTRKGFSYGTLVGHPVSGEEAFVVHRQGDQVVFTMRSITRSGRGLWRVLFPALLVAQRHFHGRYQKALISAI